MLTPVTIEASYSDAPIGKFDVIEVYSKDNCVAYSVTESKTVPMHRPGVAAIVLAAAVHPAALQSTDKRL